MQRERPAQVLAARANLKNGGWMHTKNILQERYYTPLRGKAAYLRDWQNNPVKLDQIPSGENVGLLLEHAGLTDIDLDSPEIKAMLSRFVRTSTFTIGRGGKASHYFYEGELPNDEDMKDLDGKKMVEVPYRRSTQPSYGVRGLSATARY